MTPHFHGFHPNFLTLSRLLRRVLLILSTSYRFISHPYSMSCISFLMSRVSFDHLHAIGFKNSSINGWLSEFCSLKHYPELCTHMTQTNSVSPLEYRLGFPAQMFESQILNFFFKIHLVFSISVKRIMLIHGCSFLTLLFSSFLIYNLSTSLLTLLSR